MLCPPLLIHRAVSIIHFVTLQAFISCESFHAKLKSGISGINGELALGTRFDLIYAEGVCCRRHYHKVSQIRKSLRQNQRFTWCF